MENDSNAFLHFLYCTVPGRMLLRLLSGRAFSKLCGFFLDTPLSKPFIKRFVKKNHIDLSEYEADHFENFNYCFSRRIRPELRPIEPDPAALISPCDGALSVYRVTNNTVLPIKQTYYSMNSLLEDDYLAARYINGYCFVFRLRVNDYHRYHYPADGIKSVNYFLKGRLHTVRPVALEKYSVFTKNCREFTTISTERFGLLTQVEVGALLVGKIKNFKGAGEVRRGEEKGTFLYGGSTIVLLVEKDCIEPPNAFLDATEAGVETPIRMGERIAVGTVQQYANPSNK